MHAKDVAAFSSALRQQATCSWRGGAVHSAGRRVRVTAKPGESGGGGVAAAGHVHGGAAPAVALLLSLPVFSSFPNLGIT